MHRYDTRHILIGVLKLKIPQFSTLITTYFPVLGDSKSQVWCTGRIDEFAVCGTMGSNSVPWGPFWISDLCSWFRGTRFRVIGFPNRQIFCGFHKSSSKPLFFRPVNEKVLPRQRGMYHYGTYPFVSNPCPATVRLFVSWNLFYEQLPDRASLFVHVDRGITWKTGIAE